jgi:hypothetical protein
VFTARYALSPYIKQIRFVFKGLIPVCAWERYLSTSTQFCSEKLMGRDDLGDLIIDKSIVLKSLFVRRCSISSSGSAQGGGMGCCQNDKEQWYSTKIWPYFYWLLASEERLALLHATVACNLTARTHIDGDSMPYPRPVWAWTIHCVRETL